jgi:putative flippase GtrA
MNPKKKAALIWFITEIVQIIFVVMGGIMLLWLYAPFNALIKLGITTLTGIIIYDIFKSFVYVRWILWKESNMEEEHE